MAESGWLSGVPEIWVQLAFGALFALCAAVAILLLVMGTRTWLRERTRR